MWLQHIFIIFHRLFSCSLQCFQFLLKYFNSFSLSYQIFFHMIALTMIAIISSNLTHGHIRIIINRKLHGILLIRIHPTKLTNLELLLWSQLLWNKILWIRRIAELIRSNCSWIILQAAYLWLISLFSMILCLAILYTLMECSLLILFYIWISFHHCPTLEFILTIRMMIFILYRRNRALNLFIIMYYRISFNHKICGLWFLFKIILLMYILYYLFIFTLNIFDLLF